jgi:BNR repeat-like domain
MSRLIVNRFKAILFLLVSFLFFIGLISNPSITKAQSGNWMTPMMISSTQATSWFPDITSDAAGRIHVVWAGGTQGYDTVLYTSTLDGRHWSDVNDIAALAQVSDNNSAATRPALWVDKTGHLNLSYVSGDLYYSQAPAASAYSAASWESPLKMNGDQIAYFSRIIEDDSGQLHLFFTQNVISINCAQCYHLFYRRSTDGGKTWSTAFDISADGTGSAKPQIITDKNGSLYAVWESGTGGGQGQLTDPTTVKFAASHDRGKTWSVAANLSPSTFRATKNISVGLDNNGHLITVWLAIADNNIYYQTSQDGGKTWSGANPIDGITGSWAVYPGRLDDFSMVSDSSGMVHLVLVGQIKTLITATPKPSTSQTPTSTPTPTPLVVATAEPATLDLLHLTWNGHTWSEPDVIADYKGDVPEWPRISISNGNMANVVWFVRDQANIWLSDNAHYRIWYSRTQLAADAIPTVVVLDKSKPAIQLTPIQTVTISQPAGMTDLIPTLAPYEKTQRTVIYSENDYVNILAKSIIPSALLILTISIFFLRRRR